MIISLELCEAIEELADYLEATVDEEKQARRRKRKAAAAAALLLLTKKRQRDTALAFGLIGQGTDGARAAAAALPKTAARKLRRKIDVAAFQAIGPRGALKDPLAIAPGDTLYISPVGQPGTGLVTKDPTRIPYAVAGELVPAGASRLIRVTLYEKLWLTDGRPCEVCEENSIAGWIPIDKTFPSGDWEPLAHPNCKCSLEVRRVD
jgi:hypothetical protein